MLNFDDIKVLTFDCYGTLIDWEGGILSALKPLLSRSGTVLPDSELLRLYGRFEREAQGRADFVNYRTVLRMVAKNLSGRLNLDLKPQEENVLSESIADWLPFADTVAALKRLKERFRLGILSNVDDELFRPSQTRMEVPFDWVITSEQLGSYKPAERNFLQAIAKMEIDPGQHVHVAQSLYHDIVPAGALGIKTVWVNRRGAASTPTPEATPDLETPDLQTLVKIIFQEPAKDS